MSSRTRSRKQASIGSNHSLRRPTPISASEPRTGNFVLLLVMAWSPPAHNAGNVRVSAPGDYATFNSNHTPDGTVDRDRSVAFGNLTPRSRRGSSRSTTTADNSESIDLLTRQTRLLRRSQWWVSTGDKHSELKRAIERSAASDHGEGRTSIAVWNGRGPARRSLGSLWGTRGVGLIRGALADRGDRRSSVIRGEPQSSLALWAAEAIP